MLPYMEQTPIYNAINFNFCSGYSYGGYCNITANNKLIATFMCPSDTNVGYGGAPSQSLTLAQSWGQANYPPNINSYKGSIGTTTSRWGWTTGFMQCQPDPMGFGTPNPCSGVLDGAVRLLCLQRHSNGDRWHFQYDCVRGVAGRRPGNFQPCSQE